MDNIVMINVGMLLGAASFMSGIELLNILFQEKTCDEIVNHSDANLQATL
jgi:hypothetical protein